MTSLSPLRVNAILLGLCLFLTVAAALPAQNLAWLRTIGGDEGEFRGPMALDSDGNVYAGGTFGGTADFDPGPGVEIRTNVPDSEDAFILKLDRDGAFHWVATIAGDALKEVRDIAVHNGSVYVVGGFEGTAEFDPEGSGLMRTSAGDDDVYVLKLDGSDGSVDWVYTVGDTGFDGGKAVALDAAGNVYTAGGFRSTVDFDPGNVTPDDTLTHSGGGIPDTFAVKLDSSGAFQWVRQLANAEPEAAAVDNAGNLLITGGFRNTQDFDPGPGVFNLASAGQTDIFVWKLTAAGDFVAAVRAGSPASGDFGWGLVVGASDEVVVAGTFRETVDFDPRAGTEDRTSAGVADFFVWKLDSNLDLIWVRTLGSAQNERRINVGLDDDNYVYLGVNFEEAFDFDPGPGEFVLRPGSTPGGEDATAILKLDASGDFVWALGLRGDDDVNFGDLTVSGPGAVHISGEFEGTADFDPGPGELIVSSQDLSDDVYLLKLIGPVDLSLSKTANESVVTHGDTITYTLTARNNSEFDAPDVVVVDNLPAGTSVTSAPGCTVDGGTATCPVGLLRAGGTASVTIGVRVSANALNDVTNRATVSFAGTDPNLGNNAAEVTTQLEGRTQLSLSQFISPNPLVAGEPATKRISVTAVGPGAATGVVLTDPLPAGLTFVSAPPGCVFASGAVTCTPGTLLVNQRALYEIQVMVDANATGSITNVVTATANEADEPAVSSRTVPVNVGGLPIPTPLENGVVDTADFIPFGEPGHPMAPKSLVSIFGSGFIPEGSFSASTIPLPTMLGGLMVSFDGIKAPLILVRPDLIICQIPMGVSLPSATMVIDNGGAGKAVSAPQEVQVAEHSPGIFTLMQDGEGQAIVVHAGTADLAAPVGTVGNSRPAREGDNLTIYANGLGPVDPPIADGANSCEPDGSNVVLHHTLTTPIIRIGGVEVPEENVLFSGSSPASVGVNEVVFTMPPGTPTGDAVSLTIEIGGVVSKETTMAVE